MFARVLRIGMFLCLVGAFAQTCSAQQVGPIKWLKSARKATELAVRTGKPILVFVRSARCHFCDKLKANVLQRPNVASRVTRDFVPLVLSQEDNAEVLASLKVTSFPSTLVFTPKREFVHRVDGYVGPDKFLAEIDKAKLVATKKPAGQAESAKAAPN